MLAIVVVLGVVVGEVGEARAERVAFGGALLGAFEVVLEQLVASVGVEVLHGV
jgi:hypothetical protein